MSVKQVIVVRKDLKMRRGKECAQASHASMAVITNLMKRNPDGDLVIQWRDLNGPLEEWLEGAFAKITVQVNSEKELFDLYIDAKKKGILCSLIQDAGRTEFNGVPTYTCVAIGPDYSDKIDEITGHLKLY